MSARVIVTGSDGQPIGDFTVNPGTTMNSGMLYVPRGSFHMDITVSTAAEPAPPTSFVERLNALEKLVRTHRHITKLGEVKSYPTTYAED